MSSGSIIGFQPPEGLAAPVTAGRSIDPSEAGGGRQAIWPCRVVAWLLASLAFSVPCAAQQLPRSILVLEQSDVRGQFYAAIFSALRDRVNAADSPVSIYVENLDLNRFGGAEYERAVRDLIHVKYRNKPVGVVVAIGPASLSYALRWRSDLWANIPIVFGFVDEAALPGFTLPSDATGTTTRQSLEDMVSAARAVVPGLEHVAVVGDDFKTQSIFKHFPGQIPAVAAEVDLIDLTGLPMTELRKRVGALPERTAILYTAMYSDGAGTYFPPANAVAMIAEVANRPIIVPFETYLGLGAAGGYVAIPSVIGDEAAKLALQIIDGRKPSSIPIEAGNSLRSVYDWQAMQRWGVLESNLPRGSEIRNRVLPLWKEYPLQAAGISIVVLLQSAFIVGLLYEHRRRRKAEDETRARMSELAHMNRRATAGELSASIAHEVNQPLAAMFTNTEAAEDLLESGAPDIAEIKEILADIKRDNLRANDVVVRLRRLLQKAPLDAREVDLNDTVRDVFAFVSVEASASEIELSKSLAAEPLRVLGDPVHLQQVVLNLVMNGIDAVREFSEQPRRIICRTARLDRETVELSVSDTGPPISPDTLARVFEPFFTTKKDGMGMGLAIARSIIETHGGSVSASGQPSGGATFRIQLPLMQAAAE
jgi:signal transduction histidine kinase